MASSSCILTYSVNIKWQKAGRWQKQCTSDLKVKVKLAYTASLVCSSDTSAASGHSDCPTVISVDSNQSWSGIHSSTGTGISTERSSVFSWGYDVSHRSTTPLWETLSVGKIISHKIDHLIGTFCLSSWLCRAYICSMCCFQLALLHNWLGIPLS